MKKTSFDTIFLIEDICRKKVRDRAFISEATDKAVEEFGVPRDKVSDVLSLRQRANENDLFLLFILVSVLAPKELHYYFTDAEIKTWSKEKYNTDTFSFPIDFEVIPVSDDQWIGKTSVKQLMELRDAHLIRYNENTQRTLKRVVRDGEETYRISISRKAVDGIKESFTKRNYIPNTITLNIPRTANFSYNKRKSILRVESTDYFDILDGYHRYLAMSNLYTADPDFDYEMELRLVCYPEDKAKQFIWQEDQKTKMRRVDVALLNKENPENQVVKYLESEIPFSGNLGRNNMPVDSAVLAKAIGLICFDKKNAGRDAVLDTEEGLLGAIKKLERKDRNIFDHRWSNGEIFAFVAAYAAGAVESFTKLKSFAEKNKLFLTTRTIKSSDVIKLKKEAEKCSTQS